MKWIASVCLFAAWLPGVAAADIFRSEPDLVIPDNNATGVMTTQQAARGCRITDVDIAIEMGHSWIGDLVIKVIHNGVQVVIVDRPGVPSSAYGCGSNLECSQQRRILLDDEAATELETFCPLPDIPGGPYIPSGLLSAFDGLDQSGPWTIHVSDNEEDDAGTLCAWEVRTICQTSPVEPTTWGAIKARYSD